MNYNELYEMFDVEHDHFLQLKDGLSKNIRNFEMIETSEKDRLTRISESVTNRILKEFPDLDGIEFLKAVSEKFGVNTKPEIMHFEKLSINLKTSEKKLETQLSLLSKVNEELAEAKKNSKELNQSSRSLLAANLNSLSMVLRLYNSLMEDYSPSAKDFVKPSEIGFFDKAFKTKRFLISRSVHHLNSILPISCFGDIDFYKDPERAAEKVAQLVDETESKIIEFEQLENDLDQAIVRFDEQEGLVSRVKLSIDGIKYNMGNECLVHSLLERIVESNEEKDLFEALSEKHLFKRLKSYRNKLNLIEKVIASLKLQLSNIDLTLNELSEPLEKLNKAKSRVGREPVDFDEKAFSSQMDQAKKVFDSVNKWSVQEQSRLRNNHYDFSTDAGMNFVLLMMINDIGSDNVPALLFKDDIQGLDAGSMGVDMGNLNVDIPNLEAAMNSILDTSIFDVSSISIPDVSAPAFDSSPVSVDSSASVDCSF
ncbi:hypothetical protein ABWE86_004355 [Vibrio parahaemolyticus]